MTKLYSTNGIDLCDKCRSEIRGENTYASEMLEGEKIYFRFHPGCNPVQNPSPVAPTSWSIEQHVHDNAIEAHKDKLERITTK